MKAGIEKIFSQTLTAVMVSDAGLGFSPFDLRGCFD